MSHEYVREEGSGSRHYYSDKETAESHPSMSRFCKYGGMWIRYNCGSLVLIVNLLRSGQVCHRHIWLLMVTYTPKILQTPGSQ